MNNNQHIPIDDLYLFSLQFLPEAEAKFYGDHLAECADCRRQLGWIQGDLAGYAMSVDMVDPPAGSREALMHRVAQERKAIPMTPVAAAAPVAKAAEGEPHTATVYEMKPRRTAAVMAWAGWAVAAGLAVTTGLEFQDGQRLHRAKDDIAAKFTDVSSQFAKDEVILQTLNDSDAKRVALHLPPSATGKPTPPVPEAHASYLKEKGSLVFVASNLDQLQPDKTYELWIIPAEKGAAPVPVGTFKPNARGSATLTTTALNKGIEAAAFGVTIEPEGGSKTPTMPIVLAGL
jgi:hypothetical protein